MRASHLGPSRRPWTCFALFTTGIWTSTSTAQTFVIAGTGGNTYGFPPQECQFNFSDSTPLFDQRSCSNVNATWDQFVTNADHGRFQAYRHAQWHSPCGCALGTENHGTAQLTHTDLIISGPGGPTSVTCSFSVDVSGTSFVTPGVGQASIRAKAQCANRVVDTGDVTEFSGRMTSAPVSLPVNTPIFYKLEVIANTLVRGPEVIDATANVIMQFPVGEPVFDLPAGYTANSPTLNIVDNFWLGPEACTAIMSQPLPAWDCGSGLGNVTFAVSATGGGSLAFQWRKDGVPVSDGVGGAGGAGTVSGATTATLTITNVSADDAGEFDCVVTGACGDLASNTATLAITTPCDANCDGQINGLYLQPFVDQLISALPAGCSPCVGDTNGDAAVDELDVVDFVACLIP